MSCEIVLVDVFHLLNIARVDVVVFLILSWWHRCHRLPVLLRLILFRYPDVVLISLRAIRNFLGSVRRFLSTQP